jgi:hypothetical protein
MLKDELPSSPKPFLNQRPSESRLRDQRHRVENNSSIHLSSHLDALNQPTCLWDLYFKYRMKLEILPT